MKEFSYLAMSNFISLWSCYKWGLIYITILATTDDNYNYNYYKILYYFVKSFKNKTFKKGQIFSLRLAKDYILVLLNYYCF